MNISERRLRILLEVAYAKGAVNMHDAHVTVDKGGPVLSERDQNAQLTDTVNNIINENFNAKL